MPSLPVLLSQILVAHTIELDNAFEDAIRQTYARPFMTSFVMWSNFLRYVPDSGIPVADLVEASSIPKAATLTTIGGMERWGYICVDHDPSTGIGPRRNGFGSGRGVKDATVVFPSMVGKLAKDTWEPLVAEIHERWRTRMGDGPVDDLRAALTAIVAGLDGAFPRFLPVIGGGWHATEPPPGHPAPDDSLPALLSRALLSFTLDHERDHPVPLPMSENVLRVVTEEQVPVKDFPRLAGISKEAVAMSLTWLENAGLVAVGPAPSGRGKAVAITAEGSSAQRSCAERIRQTERSWDDRFGTDAITALRSALAAIRDLPGGPDGPLSAGLVTPGGGWRDKGRYAPLTRAFISDPGGALPHYPMVLHRGGWPDGS